MLSFFFLIHTHSKKPVYNVIFVSSKTQLPKSGQSIQIPGSLGNSYTCLVSDKNRTQSYSGNPEELLAKFAGHCFDVSGMNGSELHFCYEGESTYNGKSFGVFDGYLFKNGSLRSYTKHGSLCKEADKNDPRSENKYYKMKAYYGCDNTVPKDVPSFPTFWMKDSCTLKVNILHRQLCKHPQFSNQTVIDVVCIDKAKYEDDPFQF